MKKKEEKKRNMDDNEIDLNKKASEILLEVPREKKKWILIAAINITDILLDSPPEDRKTILEIVNLTKDSPEVT